MTPSRQSEPRSRNQPFTNPRRHPPEVVGEVFDLLDNGWTSSQAARIMAKRGIKISVSTICRWNDPAQAERDRAGNREAARRKREEAAKLKPDDPYKGMSGLARKVAQLEARLDRLERPASTELRSAS